MTPEGNAVTADSKIQVNIKTGAGFEASLINVYADSPEELDHLLGAVTERIATIVSIEQLAQGAGNLAGAGVVGTPAQQPPQPSATPPPVVTPPPAVPAAPTPAAGAPEVVYDRYRNQWTYGLADAPLLPDGRGHYARKDWTSAQGKVLKAWVDPAKGPKPFPAGAAEAEIVWIR